MPKSANYSIIVKIFINRAPEPLRLRDYRNK